MIVCYLNIINRMHARAREMGYSLAIHGSLERDCDVIAVPWAEGAAVPADLAAAMIEASGGFLAPHEEKDLPYVKPHGRLCWPIHLGGGPYIDLAVLTPWPSPGYGPNYKRGPGGDNI